MFCFHVLSKLKNILLQKRADCFSDCATGVEKCAKIFVFDKMAEAFTSRKKRQNMF